MHLDLLAGGALLVEGRLRDRPQLRPGRHLNRPDALMVRSTVAFAHDLALRVAADA
ncbi:MAG: hypothetical protein ACK4ZY_02030 [Sphingomonas sp.]